MGVYVYVCVCVIVSDMEFFVFDTVYDGQRWIELGQLHNNWSY